jgi:hypothetical protein
MGDFFNFWDESVITTEETQLSIVIEAKHAAKTRCTRTVTAQYHVIESSSFHSISFTSNPREQL